ncbi:hypothetical protein [Actinocrinis sp.]|jgi:hypothetical protein|uniref:hypothetical protein n=1 Tax=Actinocrinis sp. TaxID=1920516 RepID=UPI002C00A8D1|nr:hypothetical protein [Actinocrinis sp.]HXR72925.1 hypothetical protein [Actinocrinis sp.]
MPKKFIAVAGAAVGLMLATAGAAAASQSAPADDSGAFNNPPLSFLGDQTGVLNADAPLVDLRCATPWYGSAVLGGSTPLHTQNVVCNDVDAPIELSQNGPQGGLLF